MKPESKIVRQIKSIFGTWETLGEYPDTFQGLTDAKIDLKLTRKEWGEGLGGGAGIQTRLARCRFSVIKA